MSRWEIAVVAVAVIVAIQFVLDLVAAHHTHRCRSCGRRATHFDSLCVEPEVLLCPACGGAVDDIDLWVVARVALPVGLVLVALGVATGDAVVPLVAFPISLAVLWRLATGGPVGDDPDNDDGPGPDDEGVDGHG